MSGQLANLMVGQMPTLGYASVQNSLNLNALDKTKISTLISIWKNSIASFTFAAWPSKPKIAKIGIFHWGIYGEKFVKRSQILECLHVGI